MKLYLFYHNTQKYQIIFKKLIYYFNFLNIINLKKYWLTEYHNTKLPIDHILHDNN